MGRFYLECNINGKWLCVREDIARDLMESANVECRDNPECDCIIMRALLGRGE
ncbi:MAG: hypothetical protein F7B59_04860 [Desulfurococcales archaeon]|nr:hypothetical protein [Desulfurococcales archaeon]